MFMRQSNPIAEVKNNTAINQLCPSFILRCSFLAAVLIFWAVAGFLGYCIGQYVSNHINEPFLNFLPTFIKSFF